MYRAAARRVCRCHGMDRDEAQQPPPICWLPHRAIATGVGWLRSFWCSTPSARAPGVPALGRATVAELATDWLARKQSKAPSHYRMLESAWRVHVQPRWGAVRVADVGTI